MPEQASTVAGMSDALYMFILWLSAFFFALIVGATVWFAFRYRRRGDNDRTSPIKHNTRLEVVWSIIPTLLLLVMFWWGFQDWMVMNIAPDNALEVRVKAQKWSWQFEYPRYGATSQEPGTPAGAALVVPANTPVKLIMSSSDVLHSFYVPAFRLKKDVVPGRYTTMWFESPKPGTYDVLCAEYCGTDHSRMITRIIVKSKEDFKEWVENGAGLDWKNTPLDQIGALLYKNYGCQQCHSIDGTPNTGPTMQGLWGKDESCTDGSTVKVDENYVKESILYPGKKVVQGYAPKMPSFKGKMKDREIDALIEFMKDPEGAMQRYEEGK